MAEITMKSGSSSAVFAEVALMKAPKIRFSATKQRKSMVSRSLVRSTRISEIRLASPVVTRALARMKLAIFRIITGSPSMAKAGRIFITPVRTTTTMTSKEVR